jgi:hypothetical protein
VAEHFFDGHGVDLATVVIAGFDGVAEVAATDLCGEVVGDDFAGALLLYNPGHVRQGDPDRLSPDVEADVGRIGMACGDGDQGSTPGAVERCSGPAVGHGKVFIHAARLVDGRAWGKPRAFCGLGCVDIVRTVAIFGCCWKVLPPPGG